MGCRKINRNGPPELKRFLPETNSARLLYSRVIKRGMRHSPHNPAWIDIGCHKRPHKNLFLAGDWTDTGLPATIEGAVLSGYKCAEIICHL